MVSMPRRFRLASQDWRTYSGLPLKPRLSGILRIAHDAEFGGDDELVASAFDGASDEFFVDERAVDVGCVEELDAEFEGAVDGGEGFGVVASAIKLGHAHAAQAHGGNGEGACSKFAGFHNEGSRGLDCSSNRIDAEYDRCRRPSPGELIRSQL